MLHATTAFNLFFFNDTATTEIYTLSLHDALPIWFGKKLPSGFLPEEDQGYIFVGVQLPFAASTERTDAVCRQVEDILDRKSTRLNSSHTVISYAVFCFQKKNSVHVPCRRHCTCLR